MNQMTRRQRLRQYKQYANLPRYDLAVKPRATGYQLGNDYVNSAGFTENQGESTQGEVASTKANRNATYAEAASSIGSNLLQQGFGLLNGTGSSTASSVAGSTLASNLSNSATQSIASGLANDGYNLGASMLTNGTNTATNGAANTTTNAVTGTVGKAMPYVNMALGTLQQGSALLSSPVTSSGDIYNRLGTGTAVTHGKIYNTYSGPNTSDEMALYKAKESARTGSSVGGGAKAGAGAGALIGSIWGPVGSVIGTAAGTILGGLTGGLLGKIGAGARRRKMYRTLANIAATTGNYNDQNESVAASQGLREEFNNRSNNGVLTADHGKDYNLFPKYNGGKQMANVWTPAGEQYGPVNSLVGKGESIIDYQSGEGTYVDKGTKRVDDQPSVAQDGDRIVIAGNDTDMTTGESFADQVAPFTKQLQALNKTIQKIQNGKGDEKTKQFNLQQANTVKDNLLQQMKKITDRQDAQHQMMGLYNNTPQYYDGKDFLNALGSVVPYGLGMLAPITQYNQYKHMTPTAQNSYVPNANADRALNILGTMRFNPYSQVQALRGANKQGIYQINQSGYSPGQRMSMLAAQNSNFMKNLANVYSQADEINNKYKTQYAQAAMSEGQNAATRQQQALATQQENYRQAVAKRLLGMETAKKGMLQIANTALKNLYDQSQFNKSMNYNNRLLNLYDRNQQGDVQSIRYGITPHYVLGNNGIVSYNIPSTKKYLNTSHYLTPWLDSRYLGNDFFKID